MQGKRQLLILVFGLVLVLAMTACGGENDGSDVEKQDGKIAKELTVFHFDSSKAGEVDAINSAFQASSGVKTTTEVYASDHATVLATRDAANNLPDIFDTGSYGERALEKYYEVNKIQPVQDLAIFDLLDDGYKEGLRSEDGNIYLVPKSAQPIGIIYNKDLFEKAGISEAPETLDELKEAVDKLNQQGITPFGVGGGDGWMLGTNTWSPALQMLGTDEWLNEKWHTGEGSLGDFAMPAFDFLDLTLANCNETPLEIDYVGLSAMFATEQVAMIVSGNWIMTEVASLNEDMEQKSGFFPIPFSNDPEVNQLYLFSNYYLVSADADFEVVDAYFSFLFDSEEGVQLFKETMQNINPYGITFDSNSVNTAALELIAQGKAVPNHFTQNKPEGFWQYEASILQEYLGGSINQEEVIEKMDEAWDQLLE